MIRADLHIHTYYSDGLMSPADAVAEAKANAVGLISVTDHDCMLACKETESLCAGAGLRSVNGIEVSAYENGVKIHILGYGADADNSDFKQFLDELYLSSFARAEDIIAKLRRNGIEISLDEILKYRKHDRAPVHTMHISRACAEKGYCGNAFAFYEKYLASGRCAFSDIGRPPPSRAVEAVAAGGGVCSLAHPGRIAMSKSRLLELIGKLKDRGLYGIEAVYTTHTVTETAYYKETAAAFGLEITGGSDTHFADGRHKIGSPAFYLDEAVAKRLNN